MYKLFISARVDVGIILHAVVTPAPAAPRHALTTCCPGHVAPEQPATEQLCISGVKMLGLHYSPCYIACKHGMWRALPHSARTTRLWSHKHKINTKWTHYEANRHKMDIKWPHNAGKQCPDQELR